MAVPVAGCPTRPTIKLNMLVSGSDTYYFDLSEHKDDGRPKT
jgi:hypothetical protein